LKSRCRKRLAARHVERKSFAPLIVTNDRAKRVQYWRRHRLARALAAKATIF
jgi:hypothetical protein